MADFNLINDIAAKACGIAPRNAEGWPSYDVVPAPKPADGYCAACDAEYGEAPSGAPCTCRAPAQPVVLSQAQQTFITIARGAARMLQLAAEDMERNCMVAAERSRHQAYELVRQLGPLVLEAHEELCGPATFCPDCGDIEELCQCDGDARF